LSTESSRAIAVETDISGNLSTEVSTARSAEGVLSTGLSTEASRARSAESVLSTDLSTEASTARSTETILSNDISNIDTTLNETGVEITSVEILDPAGVVFNNDASLNVTGAQPAMLLMDFSGNLIVYLNTYFFRYNIVDVSTYYNGIGERP